MIETSFFGAEFVAMKQGIDELRGFKYKLNLMGIPISGLSYIYGYNMSVVHNTFRSESVLRKKCNLICHHAFHDSLAMGESPVRNNPNKEKVADLMTKLLYGQSKRYLVHNILYNIYDYQ